MKTSWYQILGLFLLLILPFEASAGMGDKLDDWFGDMNYVNTTNPGVYETQSARYATLGGFSYRAPITQPFNLLSIQTPKFSAGCGGIDFFTGGFSAIDADKFVEMLRQLVQVLVDPIGGDRCLPR